MKIMRAMGKNLIFDLRVRGGHLRVLNQVVHSSENEQSAYLVEEGSYVGERAPRVENITLA